MMTEKAAEAPVNAVQATSDRTAGRDAGASRSNSPEDALAVYREPLGRARTCRNDAALFGGAKHICLERLGVRQGKAEPCAEAMQLPTARVETSLRVSLSAENTAEEMDAFADALRVGIETLSHA